MNRQLFRKRNIKEQPKPEPEKKDVSLSKVEFPKLQQPEQPKNWSNDIAELETYFAGIHIPAHPIRLNQCSIITDCTLFIESHLENVKHNNGNMAYLPYLHRLNELKRILE